MENYFEHLLAPDGNQELALSIISMFEELDYYLSKSYWNKNGEYPNYGRK